MANLRCASELTRFDWCWRGAVPDATLFGVTRLNVTDVLLHQHGSPQLLAPRNGCFAASIFALLTLLSVSCGMLQAAQGVRYDHVRGLYTEPFRLKLKPNPPGAQIHYTLDGSEPSATNGLSYSGPIWITNTAIVRAVSSDDFGDSPTTEAHTFVFPALVADQVGQGLPQSWGANEGKPVPAAYSVHLGAAPSSRGDLDKALQMLPSVSIVLPAGALFGAEDGIYTHTQETGDAWERPASVEFLPANDAKGFHVDCGLRIQGGWSRRPEESPKHSFRLIFHKRYGTSHLKYPLFGQETEAFSTLVLRAGNNNTWLHPESAERLRADYIRDAWMRQTYAAMGHPSARSRPVHVYLNGLYWGLFDLTERPDAHFDAARLGGAEKDYDARNADKILAGDDVAWKALFGLVNAGVTNSAQYAAAAGLLDMPAFIDFMILNLYGANADIDRGSNWYAARKRNPPQPLLFLVWDGERTLEGVEDDRLAQDDDECPTRLFQKLRMSEDFRRAFAARAKELLEGSGLLAPAAAGGRYKILADALDPAIAAEAARWGSYRHYIHAFRTGPYEDYSREEHWRTEVRHQLGEYFPKRSEAVIRQFREAGLYGP